MVTALLVKLASRSHIGQNGHTILVKGATYSRIAIKRVNVTLFWSKSSQMRITTKTATDFSSQWRTIRITTIRGASLWMLTHWGRVTHICVGKQTTIGSDNGLSPGRRQTTIWTNAGILLFGPLGTNFSEILIGIQTFSFKKMHLKMSSAKWRPFVSASMC